MPKFICIMHKNVFGRQFKRDANERKALFKSLLTSLVLEESIKTTEQKAKAIKADADKLVTKARKDRAQALRLLQPELQYPAVLKMLDEIAPRFANRNGGYTRVIKLGHRQRDDASMALIEWTEKRVIVPVTKGAKKEKKASDVTEPAESTAQVAQEKPVKTAKTKKAEPKTGKAKTTKKKEAK